MLLLLFTPSLFTQAPGTVTIAAVLVDTVVVTASAHGSVELS